MFYIYYNWHIKRGAIHRAECGNCKDGKGKHVNASAAYGAWHGPYTSGLTAVVEAHKLNPNIHFCRQCGPRKSERKGVGDDTAV